MSGFENTLKRMGLKPAGGQHALRSPAMRQGAIGASAVQSAQAGVGTPGLGAPGVPQLSDDPQSQAFSALVKQMLPNMNLPILKGASGNPAAGLPVEGSAFTLSAQKLHRKKIGEAVGGMGQMEPGATFGGGFFPGLPAGEPQTSKRTIT